jgi:hypothetical protein
MMFVHLTTQSNIGKIKANGLKLGDGRRGRGLYAMPLLSLIKRNDIMGTIEFSSLSFWKWLIKERQKYAAGQGKTCAVIFRLTEQHWPLMVYIDLSREQAERFIPALPEPNCKLFTYNPSIKTFTKDLNYSNYILGTEYKVYSAKGIGKLFNIYKNLGCTPAIISDCIEVVIPKTVSSDCIEKILAYYKTNDEFRKIKYTVKENSAEAEEE